MAPVETCCEYQYHSGTLLDPITLLAYFLYY